MNEELNEYAKEFIEISTNIEQNILVIGYDNLSIIQGALNNDKKVIAIDCNKNPIFTKLNNTHQHELRNLFLKEFFVSLNIPNGSVGAVVINEIMHFLEAEAVKEVIRKIHDLLVPGGKFYFTEQYIYDPALQEKMLSVHSQNFLSSGESLKSIAFQEQEPTFLYGDTAKLSMPLYFSHSENTVEQANVPNCFHVFDIPLLNELLSTQRFIIDKVGLFDNPGETDVNGTSRGHVSFIATKDK